jgi:hypothetical protein
LAVPSLRCPYISAADLARPQIPVGRGLGSPDRSCRAMTPPDPRGPLGHLPGDPPEVHPGVPPRSPPEIHPRVPLVVPPGVPPGYPRVCPGTDSGITTPTNPPGTRGYSRSPPGDPTGGSSRGKSPGASKISCLALTKRCLPGDRIYVFGFLCSLQLALTKHCPPGSWIYVFGSICMDLGVQTASRQPTKPPFNKTPSQLLTERSPPQLLIGNVRSIHHAVPGTDVESWISIAFAGFEGPQTFQK